MHRVISFTCIQKAINSYVYSSKLTITLQLWFKKARKSNYSIHAVFRSGGIYFGKSSSFTCW